MDAKDFFNWIAAENYKESKNDPTNLRKLWNAVVSMNTVAESLALDQANYPSLLRKDVDKLSAGVRAQYPDLNDIKVCAETLKHVRRHVGQQLVASSTGILPGDPNTYEIPVGSTSYKLADTLDRSFATLKSIPEFK